MTNASWKCASTSMTFVRNEGDHPKKIRERGHVEKFFFLQNFEMA